MKKLAFLIALLNAVSAGAQTLSPFMGVANVQFFGNDGALLTSGCLYVFAAGTSTQAASYSDSAGTLNTNPVCFGSGARASIWLTTANFYKLQLCSANDGVTCSPSDVLYSVDNLPGGASGGGGGSSCASGCLGFFISGTASPSTSGTLRLASGDSFGWRNAAGSANLLFSKDANDQLGWAGGSIKFPLVGAPACIAGFSQLWSDNSANRWKMCNNGGTASQVVASGNDIDATDAVKDVHFGSSQAPFSSTLPSTNQFLAWNGSQIVGTGAAVDLTAQAVNISNTTIITPSANGFYSAACWEVVTQQATTSSTLPQCTVSFTDADSSVVIGIPLNTQNSGNTIGAVALPLQPGFFYAKSGQPIQYRTAGYASSGGTPMQYSLHFRLVGPF